MTTLRKAGPVILGAAALAAAVLSAAPVASADPGPVPSAPCYNGITPFNPYVDNCSIPSRPSRVLGSAPDQTAILNCSVGSRTLRAICLSQFVNGGPYPGIAVGIG
ncbi:hypothetical protein ORI20_03595 [Mycobacterium sp. CVI_P3]|uniref:Intersectin-EH binding protein Ibp1 n=1 Tax=Mycobacterium pinniadriaticum TaxID=2994102 RepID=A0ABT3S8E2_9MYCO|nr:hypothetical protein [Mycobacterium pinniadriaticum]MCX2929344.1 hypothetical protein [Mycobacterium pinniadriaticum]MCX2935768.1 hypothetical protein [Mycobacterium pinniadriaticum]